MSRVGRRRLSYLLFLIPVAAVVYPPLYDRRDPAIGGVPFFVWYQLAAVVLGGVVTALVHHLSAE